MQLVDSHAHLDMYSADELPHILARAKAAGVRTILAIGIGEGPGEMHRGLEIAEATHSPELPEIYATVGIHPQEAASATPDALARLASLAAKRRCIAVGEIGLDYYHVENPEPEVQKQAFIAQMDIAAKARKAIVIHCRTSELAVPAAKQKFGTADAWQDVLALISEHWAPHGLAGIMHCFSGTAEQAQRSIELGFYISFAGNVTYPAAVAIQEAAKAVPPDRMLVETDAPFLSPIPHRGRRNESALMVHTALFLAELRGVSEQELAAQTTANFHRLFPAAATSVTSGSGGVLYFPNGI